MKKPTILEAVAHLAEHYGLSRTEVAAIIRTPTHPTELRDTFAGQAMQAILGNDPAIQRIISAAGNEMISPDAVVATAAYGVADALLKARVK